MYYMLLHSYLNLERDFLLDLWCITQKSLRVRHTSIHSDHLMYVVIELNMCFLSSS